MKNFKYLQSGFTLVEMLVVISIIAIISIYFLINLKPNTIELLRMDTTRLSADIRYVRNLVATRAIYNGPPYNGTFPTGGYGILIHNGSVNNNPALSQKSYYKLYAGSTNNVIKTVVLSNVNFRLFDPNNQDSGYNPNNPSERYFAFDSENSISTSLTKNAEGDYQVEIYYTTDRNIATAVYYKNTITIGKKTSDNFLWSNLAISYDTNQPICGNGIIEIGEACERLTPSGALNDPNCIPARDSNNNIIALGCHDNRCGDGYWMQGVEECEIGPNAVDGFRVYSADCVTQWCYTCDATTADGSIATCSLVATGASVAVGGSACCPSSHNQPSACFPGCTHSFYGCPKTCIGIIDPGGGGGQP